MVVSAAMTVATFYAEAHAALAGIQLRLRRQALLTAQGVVRGENPSPRGSASADRSAA